MKRESPIPPFPPFFFSLSFFFFRRRRRRREKSSIRSTPPPCAMQRSLLGVQKEMEAVSLILASQPIRDVSRALNRRTRNVSPFYNKTFFFQAAACQSCLPWPLSFPQSRSRRAVGGCCPFAVLGEAVEKGKKILHRFSPVRENERKRPGFRSCKSTTLHQRRN